MKTNNETAKTETAPRVSIWDRAKTLPVPHLNPQDARPVEYPGATDYYAKHPERLID
jgi:hypothetical protein